MARRKQENPRSYYVPVQYTYNLLLFQYDPATDRYLGAFSGRNRITNEWDVLSKHSNLSQINPCYHSFLHDQFGM